MEGETPVGWGSRSLGPGSGIRRWGWSRTEAAHEAGCRPLGGWAFSREATRSCFGGCWACWVSSSGGGGSSQAISGLGRPACPDGAL